MVHWLDKDFETNNWKMGKELKENVDKVQKMLHEQNGNIDEEINIKKNQKRNFGAEMYND